MGIILYSIYVIDTLGILFRLVVLHLMLEDL